MLSLLELRRCAEVLGAGFANHRLERIVQPDDLRVALQFYGRSEAADSGAKRTLLLCCHPEFARVSMLDSLPKAPATPPAFANLLRARLPRAVLRRTRLRGEDRQLSLELESREGSFELLLSLMGARSNLYLLDAEALVVGSLRPLARTRRVLAIGEPWCEPEGAPAGPGDDRFAEASGVELLAAVEQAYADRELSRASDALAAQVARAIRKERKQAERRVERIERELAEAATAGELQRQGELLKGVLGQIQPGATEVRARDYETGEEVAIPLDPALSPKQNLAAAFKRYQKLVRRLAKAGGQVERARARAAELEALDGELAQLLERGGANDPGISELAERPALRALLRKQTRPGAPAAREKRTVPGPFKDIPQRLHPRRYRSRDGLEIWVGRSDEGNDLLSTRLARGQDLFFHLDGAPGSHVVLRTEGRSDPPQESLLDACELAVRFSKYRNATRADVHVVPIKQVRKPRGAKPGLVYVTGGKTVHLRREEARLERVLAARIED